MLVSFWYNVGNIYLQISDKYCVKDNCYGVFVENVTFKNMRFTNPVNAITPRVRKANFGTSLQTSFCFFSC